ncbi:MAG: hypothetical protein LBI18_01715 [Planctomycetaceae bacterium]|jgi:hypothetical protein|nr:hypothetical protein [Planctomycetaceae bacterium]
MKNYNIYFHFVFLILFLTGNIGTIFAHVIRCADPKCPLCLSVTNATPPTTSITREPYHYPEDAPFGREASLAVVNPVLRSTHQSVISLRSDWEFVTDPEKVGVKNEWMKPNTVWQNKRTINVPGNWETQGVGEPGMSTPWKIHWDQGPRLLRHIYIGSAWYRKNFQVPQEWKNKRIWLKVGGVRAQGWFWVNGKPVAHVTQYCGSFRYDITDLVKPNEETVIVAQIRNDIPARTGQVSSCHIWGGIYRDIEIEATPETHLANVECFGDFDTKKVNVHLELAHFDNTKEKTADVQIDIKTLDPDQPIKPLTTVGTLRKTIELSNKNLTESIQTLDLSDFRAWSPESPNLYLAEVTLYDKDGKNITHGWSERFGIKKMEVRGKQFYLNGKPYFLRGFGDDYVYPETFISPIDRDVHRKHLKIARESGFCYVRHHTHCEIPEFYEAADELGVMIQPELPYYPFFGHHTVEFFDFDPKRDLNELIDHRRRYVSQTSYSMGNEGHLGTPLDIELKEIVHQRDPGRLVTHNDGGMNTPENSDFNTPITSIRTWKSGTFDSLTIPFVAHEYLNLGVKFDPRISERFTKLILPPRPLKHYEKQLHDIGLDQYWGNACLNAGHELQKYYQKEGIEAARFDPECDGYSFWTIIDVIINYGGDDHNFTGQGMFNPFWEPKINGTTPKDVAKYNSPTAILLQPDRQSPILVEGETVKLSLFVSHFDYQDIENGKLVWSLKSKQESGETLLANGSLDGINLKTGDVAKIGDIEFVVPQQEIAKTLIFEATLNETIQNDWKFWSFPKRQKLTLKNIAVTPDLFETLSKRYDGLVSTDSPEAKTAGIVIGTATHPETKNAIVTEKRVLIFGNASEASNVRLGWWWLGDQVGTAFAKHPVYGNFPHEEYLNPLWFRLIKRGMPISHDMSFGKLEYLSVGEGRDNYFMYVAQTAAGTNGKILITHGLDVLTETPEGNYLLDQMLQYIDSENFQPKEKMNLAQYIENKKWHDIAFSRLNGWSQTISSPEQHTGNSYIIGTGTMRFMKLNAANKIVWKSKPVNQNIDTNIEEKSDENKEASTFYWLSGVGFVPERPLNILLSMNGKKLVEFKINVSDKSWTIQQENIKLSYRRLSFMGNESTGVMELIVPKKLLTPDQPVEFQFSCENQGFNDSWIGILEK